MGGKKSPYDEVFFLGMIFKVVCFNVTLNRSMYRPVQWGKKTENLFFFKTSNQKKIFFSKTFFIKNFFFSKKISNLEEKKFLKKFILFFMI